MYGPEKLLTANYLQNKKVPCKNPPANILSTEGYVLEVDGKFKTEYESSEPAKKAGLELKKKYPHIQVKVYDAKKRTRMPVALPE